MSILIGYTNSLFLLRVNALKLHLDRLYQLTFLVESERPQVNRINVADSEIIPFSMSIVATFFVKRT